MFFSTLRRAVRERKEALTDRNYWKARALKAEADRERIVSKLEERTDFFIEREFRIFDRFFTSREKTYAVTDEIRTKAKAEQYDKEAEEAALEAYLQDKKEFLIRCAREAKYEDPEAIAAKTFEENQSRYILDFQQGM